MADGEGQLGWVRLISHPAQHPSPDVTRCFGRREDRVCNDSLARL